MNAKKNKKLTIGITGSSGFIGSSVTQYVVNLGYRVEILDALVNPRVKRKHVLPSHEMNWVFHFGASKSIASAFRNPMEIYRRNMHSTMAALDVALSKKSRFLYMSSYVYGKPEYLPLDEKHPTAVLNPYMGSKLLGEQICYQLHQCMGISVLVLRGFSLYGPTQNDEQLIPSIINSIRNKRPIIIKDPNPKRDHLFISDFLRLIGSILQSDFSGYENYNIGTGIPYQNLEVAKLANNLSKNPVPIKVLGNRRENDIASCYANIEKIANDFQWTPEIDLPAGLNKCLLFNPG